MCLHWKCTLIYRPLCYPFVIPCLFPFQRLKFCYKLILLIIRILEKQNSMSDELGRDGATVSMLQRKHNNFLQDLQSLQVIIYLVSILLSYYLSWYPIFYLAFWVSKLQRKHDNFLQDLQSLQVIIYLVSILLSYYISCYITIYLLIG